MNIDIEMENLYNIFIDVNTIYLIGVSELIFGVPTNFCVNINIDIVEYWYWDGEFILYF